MDKVKRYVEELFNGFEKTKRNRELKEELLLDLEEKYQDLIKSGKQETDAYNEVVAGIGDIDELLNISDHTMNIEQQKTKQKNALVVSICIGLYIFSFVVAIVFDEMLHLNSSYTGISFFVICGISTCILVYHTMSSPKYQKEEDTLVEEFKERKIHKDQNKMIRKSISSILWMLIVIIYLVVSFSTMAWHITWILFMIGALTEQIIDLIFKLKE